MSLKLILLAGLGGFIGSALRYIVTVAYAERFHTSVHAGFPAATLTINIIGSFVLGILVGISLTRHDSWAGLLNEPWKVFLSTGICGGFTTFSAFSAETFFMIENGNFGWAFLYITTSVVGGVLAAFAGLALIK